MSTAVIGTLRRTFARLTTSRFVRNVFVAGSGIAAAQAITLAFAPFITRLYDPEAFGVSAAFAAIIGVITPIATLGYSSAIVMPEADKEASAVARLSILCGLILAPLSLVLVYIARPWLADLTGLDSTPQVLYLIPLALLFTALLSVVEQTAIREGLFKAKARAYVESKLLINLGKLFGGLIAPSGLLLVVLTLAERLLNFIMQLVRVPTSLTLNPAAWFGSRDVLEVAKKYRDFPIFRMPQGVIRATSMGFPVIALTGFFGPASAGQYSLTVLLLGAPVMLLGESVRQVFYPKITRAISNASTEVATHIGKAAFILILIGSIPFGTIAFFGDLLVPWLSGSEWVRAGKYSQWISIWMLAMMAAEPAIAAMPGLRLQPALLGYEILITGARIAALYAGFSVGDDLTSIIFFSVTNAAGSLILLIFVISKALMIRRSKNRNTI